jgi:hypothetical protein
MHHATDGRQRGGIALPRERIALRRMHSGHHRFAGGESKVFGIVKGHLCRANKVRKIAVAVLEQRTELIGRADET